MKITRRSGILLHPTSLPGPHGSGDLGPAARHFVDWLAVGRQSLWQVLPLGGVGPGNSPYMSPSAFAGNELLIDLTALRDAGWLTDSEIEALPAFRTERVDYAAVRPFRMTRLRLAAQRFFAGANEKERASFAAFCADDTHRQWLDDYALFMALDGRHSSTGKAWQDWPPPLARREPGALRAEQDSLADECAFWKFCQWCFDRQWAALKEYANGRGVNIVGDLPIFVSPHSADVWAHQELFDLKANGRARVVAGVPPDYFSATGQYWGNPLYDWRAHRRENYRWWTARLRRGLALCDVLRIDHFRGFESYWEIPAGSATAADGRWRPGPGGDFFRQLRQALPCLPGESDPAWPRIIAEDLGIITPAVEKLRLDAGLPGMRVLQFAFDGDSDNLYLPHNHEARTVVYTGTHDNDTSVGWWCGLSPGEQDYVRRYLETPASAIHWDLIHSASASVAAFSIFPMQDVLGLDSSARMNRPGVSEGSGEWRFSWDRVLGWHADRLAALASLHGRAPQRIGQENTGEK